MLVGARFSAPVQISPGAHPASHTMGTGSFPGIKSSWGMMLTPHPILVPPMGRTACTEPRCLYKGALYLLHRSLQQGTKWQNCRIIIGCVFRIILTPWNYLGDLFLLQRKYLARTMKPLQKVCFLAVKMHTTKVLPSCSGLLCCFRKVSQVTQLSCIQK